MKIQAYIAIWAVVLFATLLGAALASTLFINQIRLGGPLQLRQQQTADYIADILPPPAYIIEPYLEATLLMRRPDTVDAHAIRLSALKKTYDERHAYWLASEMDPALVDRLTRAAHAPAQEFWREIDDRFLPAVRAGRSADAEVSYRRLGQAYAAHRSEIDAAVKAAMAFQATLIQRSNEELARAFWILGAIALAMAGGLLAFFWGVNRRAIAPLGTMATAMERLSAGDFSVVSAGDGRSDEIGAMAKAVTVFRETGIAKQAADAAKARADAEQRQVVQTVSGNLAALSEGDLTANIKADFPPEYGALKSNFNQALAKLRGLIGSVSESANAITTGSSEIAQASEDLARRTESNAASLEETAASITQMDGRLKATASAASRTVERADQAIATVGGGRAVAEEAVQAMGRVSDSAKGIDSVIEGLDKIAFQTRVLAMNAAVEAGRAGDAGRGFAVVADLVSSLAMRAEEEAKRARDQLTLTQTDIVTAVAAVTKVDGALANISGDVTQVHELLATIASDNQAQSSAITQISAAIGTMDQSTQQNAAMVEQTSAAARNLVSEVNALSAQAGKFVVGGTPARRATPNRSAVTQPDSYRSPVKPLPAAAIPALTRSGSDDWNDF